MAFEKSTFLLPRVGEFEFDELMEQIVTEIVNRKGHFNLSYHFNHSDIQRNPDTILVTVALAGGRRDITDSFKDMKRECPFYTFLPDFVKNPDQSSGHMSQSIGYIKTVRFYDPNDPMNCWRLDFNRFQGWIGDEYQLEAIKRLFTFGEECIPEDRARRHIIENLEDVAAVRYLTIGTDTLEVKENYGVEFYKHLQDPKQPLEEQVRSSLIKEDPRKIIDYISDDRILRYHAVNIPYPDGTEEIEITDIRDFFYYVRGDAGIFSKYHSESGPKCVIVFKQPKPFEAITYDDDSGRKPSPAGEEKILKTDALIERFTRFFSKVYDQIEKD